VAAAARSEEKKAETARLSAVEERRAQDAAAALQELAARFPAGSQWSAVISELLQRMQAARESRAALVLFQDWAKQQTVAAFRDQNRLMQSMKDIKRERQRAHQADSDQ
jgi:hypothetical protein